MMRTTIIAYDPRIVIPEDLIGNPVLLYEIRTLSPIEVIGDD